MGQTTFSLTTQTGDVDDLKVCSAQEKKSPAWVVWWGGASGLRHNHNMSQLAVVTISICPTQILWYRDEGVSVVVCVCC